MYWFNTLQFTRPDLLKLPSYSPTRLGRRAQNYLLLGFSLPVLSDLHAQTSTEYLKALNSLFSEFDTYQSMHPPDGTSSLSRARIPQMFKRATQSGKVRRNTDASVASFATDSSGGTGGLLTSTGSSSNLASGSSLGGLIGPGTSSNGASGGGAVGGGVGSTGVLLPSVSSSSSHSHAQSAPSEPLLPSEHYTHLLTPPLPFEPDFFETFATLCDVLIDSYTRITQLISEGNDAVSQSTGEMFAKADTKVRKVIVSGMMREFEERTREGLKGEIAGIGKVVLGGLM
jgi:hypothetical protein